MRHRLEEDDSAKLLALVAEAERMTFTDLSGLHDTLNSIWMGSFPEIISLIGMQIGNIKGDYARAMYTEEGLTPQRREELRLQGYERHRKAREIYDNLMADYNQIEIMRNSYRGFLDNIVRTKIELLHLGILLRQLDPDKVFDEGYDIDAQIQAKCFQTIPKASGPYKHFLEKINDLYQQRREELPEEQSAAVQVRMTA